MKKFYLLISIFVLFLAGCQNAGTDEVTEENGTTEETKETFITLDNFNLDNHSKMIISEGSHENGSIIGSSTEDALDSNQFEAGLMRIGKESFGKDKYLLADNSIFSESEEMNDFFAKNSINILTYNYFDKAGNSEITLSGMLIGIQVGSTYSGNALTNAVNNASEKVLDIVRQENERTDIPIVIAVFQQEPNNSKIPGRFILKNEIPQQSKTIGDWTNINEKYYLFPSTDLTNDKPADAKELNSFMSDLRAAINSSDFIGDSALLLYRDNELSKVNFTININFRSNTEVVALTQKIGELVSNNEFFSTFDLEITIASNNRNEALITKSINDDDVFTHIYN